MAACAVNAAKELGPLLGTSCRDVDSSDLCDLSGVREQISN